jgi:hypothetical protein
MPPRARRSFHQIRGARLAGLRTPRMSRAVTKFNSERSSQTRLVVSSGGGHSPKWRRDGKELFYVASDGTIMAVAVSDNPLRLGPPVPLFQAPRGFAARDSTGLRSSKAWDTTPDRQRFLLPAPVESVATSPFTVVLNWQTGLTK